MPFQSKAQMAFMFANHPDIAKRWEGEYHQTGKGLPQHKRKKRKTALTHDGKTALTR